MVSSVFPAAILAGVAALSSLRLADARATGTTQAPLAINREELNHVFSQAMLADPTIPFMVRQMEKKRDEVRGDVVGGRPTAKPEPWMVTMRGKTWGFKEALNATTGEVVERWDDVKEEDAVVRWWGCGATLVAPTFLATAWHCVDGLDPTTLASYSVNNFTHEEYPGYAFHFVSESSLVEVGIGGLNHTNIPGPEFQVVGVKTLMCHPNASMEMFDLCMVQLETKVEQEVLPVARGNEGYETPGALSIGLGWGSTVQHDGDTDTDSPKPIYPDLLHEVAMPIVSNHVCNHTYSTRFEMTVDSMQLCAGDLQNGGIDTCNGDSGGPLTNANKDVLIGVTSYGFGCAWPGFPGVYARVSTALDFIQSTVSKHSNFTLPPSRRCKSRVPHVTDKWCETTGCKSAVCGWVSPKGKFEKVCRSTGKVRGVTDTWCAQTMCTGTSGGACHEVAA